MSHKHEHLLRTIFQDPINANIHWREIESLLHHLNAEIEQLSGAREVSRPRVLFPPAILPPHA